MQRCHMESRPTDKPGPPAPFVVGVARSGTTLLRMMLDAHPLLAIPAETHFAGQVVDAYGSGRGGPARAVDAIVDSPRWPDFGIPAGAFRREAAAVAPAGPGALLRRFYALYAERLGKPRWGDKTPPYLDRMADIHAALPEARFVHVVRDGRDVALSVVPLWFGPDSVAEAARAWAARIDAARSQACGASWYAEVRYEDLVAEPRAVLERVCALVDLPWDEAMLGYHERARERLAEQALDLRRSDGRTIAASDRLSLHERVGEPPRADRVGRWRTEMAAADRREFERIAGDALAELGYPLS